MANQSQNQVFAKLQQQLQIFLDHITGHSRTNDVLLKVCKGNLSVLDHLLQTQNHLQILLIVLETVNQVMMFEHTSRTSEKNIKRLHNMIKETIHKDMSTLRSQILETRQHLTSPKYSQTFRSSPNFDMAGMPRQAIPVSFHQEAVSGFQTEEISPPLKQNNPINDSRLQAENSLQQELLRNIQMRMQEQQQNPRFNGQWMGESQFNGNQSQQLQLIQEDFQSQSLQKQESQKAGRQSDAQLMTIKSESYLLGQQTESQVSERLVERKATNNTHSVDSQIGRKSHKSNTSPKPSYQNRHYKETFDKSMLSIDYVKKRKRNSNQQRNFNIITND